MEIVYSPQAIEDLQFWKLSGDKKIMSRISSLLNSIEESPFTGIGKPELLKHQLAGCWSRRIDQTHRLVYKVRVGKIEVISMRFHYQ